MRASPFGRWSAYRSVDRDCRLPMPLDAHGFSHKGSEGRRMRPPPHGHEIYFAPIFRLDQWPCHNAGMGNAVLRHESEAEARCDHGQNPVIAFTPVDHVPRRATVEQTTAIKFAIDAVEIRLPRKTLLPNTTPPLSRVLDESLN